MLSPIMNSPYFSLLKSKSITHLTSSKGAWNMGKSDEASKFTGQQ